VNLPIVHLFKNFPAFYGSAGSSLCSQEPSTGPHPEPDQSNLYHTILGIERPRVAGGGDALQIWRVAANILYNVCQ
jgi:hypothetical protein